MDTNQRRSSLLFHLGKAHSKISSLEDYIRDREKQFRSMVGRFECNDSSNVVGGGRRRVGLSHNLFRIHSRSMSHEEEEEEEMDVYSKPIANYASLKIIRVTPPSKPDEFVPFTLSRLVSREYHVSEEGVVIGSGEECKVKVPVEAGLNDHHVEIRWIPACQDTEGKPLLCERRGSKLQRQEPIGSNAKYLGHFELCDLTKGKGVFYLSHDSSNLQHSIIKEDDPFEGVEASDETPAEGATPTHFPPTGYAEAKEFTTPVHSGVRFIAGRLEFSLTALPLELLYTLRMFAAAKRGELNELKSIIESSKSSDLAIPYVMISPSEKSPSNRYSTISVVTNQGIDVNVEYQAPSYSDDAFFGQNFNPRRSSTYLMRGLGMSSPLSPVCYGSHHGDSRLLFHIAIEQNNLEMVIYLLSEKADMNLCVGELKRNALHLAAEKGLLEVMVELLRFGGDVEIKDSLHLQPLSLTSDYHIRKLLLNTVLLCAAAEEGDLEEVVRLLSTVGVSPNARGLRHKNALHLAAAKGHQQVVEVLLINGADVNAKGGTRLRTPLHYASLNDHVKVAVILLDAGANEFAHDAGGYTPLNLSKGGKMCKLLHKQPLSLCLAVQSGDVEAVKKILSRMEVGTEGGTYGDMEREVDQRNEQSHAPLHLACTSGNVEMVRLLVANGASIDLHGGSDSWTPLMYAAMAANSQVVEFLLSVGADSQEVDEKGTSIGRRVEQAMEETKTMISQLERKTHTTESVVDTSLHTLEPVSMIRQESGSSFSLEGEISWLKNRYERLKQTLRVLTSGPDQLLKCIETKNHTEFNELLKAGMVNANTMVDKYSPCSALVRVCEDGLNNFAKSLIEYGANVNPVGSSGQIPLLIAAADGNVDLVKLLHENGADINIQSEDSLTTPLHEAAAANSEMCVAYLLSVGARLDISNVAGETPFDCCTLHEVKKMLAVGPNKLLLAAITGNSEELQHLVAEEGLSPGHVFHHGVTALHEASEAGHVEVCKLLIDSGVDVNKQTHASMVTPLHLASLNNHIEIARLLISTDAKLDLKDVDGKVPFEVACSNQMRKVLVEARRVHAQPVVSRENSSKEKKCMICMDNPINTIILPCGHQAFCTNCVSQITLCALDRQTIREVITVFK